MKLDNSDNSDKFLKEKEDTSGRSLLQFIRARKLQSVFPNVDIALRLFMTLPVTNASGEHSFSKLGLIKNRLNHLSLMSIENDVLHKLEFSGLIKDFSARKSRKKKLR